MTRNQGIPERQPPSRPAGESIRKQTGASMPRRVSASLNEELSRSTPYSYTPSENSASSRRNDVEQRHLKPEPVKHAKTRPVQRTTSQTGSTPQSPTPVARQNRPENQPTAPAKNHPKRLRWLYSWKVWLTATLLVCGGSVTLALLILLKLPGLPNCPAIFWPLASASLRFECARIAASKQTAKDLLEAITLVDSLPLDHPMREEANRLIEDWSQDVLRLAEEDFNAGKLADAIADARRIPSKVSAYKLVEEQIQNWQTIWAEAEGIYKKSEEYLRQQNFRKAFSQAVRLLDVDNRYWRTTKFDELSNRITVTRNDGNKLGRAFRLADSGGLNNLMEAIKLAESIRPDSYIYKAARDAIPKFGRQMMKLAEYALERQNLKEVLNIVDKIPKSANLGDETRDFIILATAQSQIWQNTIPAVEDAIAQAQRIGRDSPLYSKAQQLITRWQLEIEGIAQLEKARLIAQSASTDDLAAGIAEASLISRSNPRWDEAQQQITRWKTQIETIQDRPILDQADQFANAGDLASLQAAIAQAEQVGRGRALYKESRSKIQTWTAQIQHIQDQPILDQARQYANYGDLRSAVATAQQIQSGRSLYSEAQTDVKRWRDRLQEEATQAKAMATMQEARKLASSGLPTALGNAIQLAAQVPESSSLRNEARTAMNEWSQQLLQASKTQSVYDLAGAITIAQKIPASVGVYSEAQELIQSWKRTLGQ